MLFHFSLLKKPVTDYPENLDQDEPSRDPTSAFVIDGYYYYRAYHSPEVGDALIQVKPDGKSTMVWDAHQD